MINLPDHNNSSVYCISFVHGLVIKRYIGSATKTRDRARYHTSLLRRNKHDNRYLQNTWNKYGESCFSFDIIEKCGLQDLRYFEKKWIDIYESYDRSLGFNIERDPLNYTGRKHSDEVKAKMSKAAYGRKHSEETKRKMSLAKLGKKNPAFGRGGTFKGRRHTEETKRKMSKIARENKKC